MFWGENLLKWGVSHPGLLQTYCPCLSFPCVAVVRGNKATGASSPLGAATPGDLLVHSIYCKSPILEGAKNGEIDSKMGGKTTKWGKKT